MSLVMNKDSSDQLFLATPSLQRLRQQIVQLTKVGPSSLGEEAGLGLFATKNIKVCNIFDLPYIFENVLILDRLTIVLLRRALL